MDELAIAFFEFTGALIFAYSICMSAFYAINPDKVNAGSFFVEYGLFIAALWGGEFTGAHYNLAITLGFYIKKGSNFPFWKLVYYPAFSFLGALSGAFLVWWLEDRVKAPMSVDLAPVQLVTEFFAEIMGTALYSFVKIYSMMEEWPFKHNPLVTITLLSILFFICRAFASRTQCINPTNALALGIVQTLSPHEYTSWRNIWVLMLGPLIGAVFAVLFLDHVYLPILRSKVKKV